MKILIMMMMTINIAWAQSVDECSQQLFKVGKGKRESKVNPACYDKFKSAAHKNGILVDEIQQKEFVAYKNSFFIKDLNTKKLQYTAGENSTLEDALAIDYNKDFKEIYILEQHKGEVKIFSSMITGDIGPYRVIRTKHIIGAVDVLGVGQNVYVLNPKDESIYVYHRMGNYYGRKGKKNLNLLKAYEKIPSNTASLELVDGQLELMDQDGKKITSIQIKN